MSDQKDKIRDILKELLSIPIEELVRTSDLGTEFGFETARSDLQQLQSYLSKLSQVKFEEVPQQTITHIFNSLNSVRNIFNQIKTFSPQELQQNNRNVIQERDKINKAIIQNAQTLFNHSATALALARTDESELAKIRKSLSSSVDEIERLKSDAEEAAKSARSAAGTTGIAEHAKIFLIEAEENNHANRWLVATIILVVVTLLWGFLSIFISPEKAIKLVYSKEVIDVSKEMAQFYLIQITIGKFIVLSILSFLTAWFAKIFNAERHNSIVNRHRHNALRTFETFSSAAGGDKDVKNAVLLQATQTIFGHQPSGYLRNENTSGNETSKVVEITKSLVSKSDA